MVKANIGITGYSGWAGEELDFLLKNHPKAEVVYREKSDYKEGNFDKVDLMLLASGAEVSLNKVPELYGKKKVVDLSGAYRLKKDVFEEWYKLKHTSPGLIEKAVYGLPEINREKIKGADFVANPGCYATAVILALYPIRDFIEDICIEAVSGKSGAGNRIIQGKGIIPYKSGRSHQHIPEIESIIGEDRIDEFFPSIDTERDRGIEAVMDCHSYYMAEKYLCDFYKSEKFVKIGKRKLDDVSKDNCCYIFVEQPNGQIYAKITSVLDNLRKGAASQAIQNMNLMFGFKEDEGLE
jgi:N-acetyl-gamma-glutamyl-phosphate reductase